jgi:two-component system, cell cycle sensor histidine kinase and response regulator CckA
MAGDERVPTFGFAAPLPSNERERLQALRRHAILDTPPEASFDRIARLTARLLKVPIALVSFIDERRQWYKARYDAQWQEVARDSSVCAYTILTDELNIVPDLSRDRRFANYPQVAGPAHLRFYASAPLKSFDGFNIGTLCGIDTQSRDFDPEQQETLSDLAALTADELRLRLALTEDRLASIVESSADAIVSKSLDGIMTSWNDAASRLFGYAPEEIIGRPGSLLVPPDRVGEEGKILAQLKRDEAISQFETVRLSKDGRRIDVSLTLSPIRDVNQRIVGTSKIARDITTERQTVAELCRMAEQLREAQKMETLGRLAGGIAHGLNNLLSVVFGHSALLALDSPSPERLRESVAQTGRAAEQAAALTRQLLAFGRQQIVEPKVLDLNAIIIDAASMLRRLFGDEVEVCTKLQAGLSPVSVDASQIHQIILNLAFNARDAMARGGKLTFESREMEFDEVSARTEIELKPGRYVLLKVSDTGAGMKPETQAHIFEPFFTTKGVGHGTGLGLSVVHGVLKQHGGHITVQSQPDVGTTFEIFLPTSEGPIEDPGVAFPSQPIQGGETILLVEDEEPVREVTELMLLSLGYRVLKASSGEEALRVVETGREKIHLLMTDILMPDMNGRDLVNVLQPRLPDLRVLFQSGYTDDSMTRHGILHTEVAFLQKPFTLEALSRKLRQVLDGPAS